VHAQRKAEQQHQHTPCEAWKRGARSVGHGGKALGEKGSERRGTRLGSHSFTSEVRRQLGRPQE
jgi:hypothetical protein